MAVEKLADDIQNIKDDLDRLRGSVSSQKEKEDKIKEIRNRANETKIQLEQEMATLNGKEKEEAEAQLDYLNEIINFELEVSVNPQNNPSDNNEQGDGNQQSGGGEQQNGDEKSWLGRQRASITSKQEWKEHPGKNALRTLGGIGLITGIWRLGKRVFGGRNKEKNSDTTNVSKREARRERRRARREARRQKSFWERPFGKILKWTGIGSGIYYVSHGIKTGKRKLKDAFNWEKDASDDSSQNDNPSENNNSPEQTTPAGNEGGSVNGADNPGENNAETFEATNANTFSNAAIKTLSKAKSFDNETKNKIKTTLDAYLQAHPILKKSADGHMIFEIGDKTEFSNTINQVWKHVLSGLNMVERGLAKTLFGGKLDNLDKTMRELSANDYKNVVFKYLGGIVKEAVQTENGTMTVQEFYNSFKKYYPNNDANILETYLTESGQADKDIKDMDIEKIINA